MITTEIGSLVDPPASFGGYLFVSNNWNKEIVLYSAC